MKTYEQGRIDGMNDAIAIINAAKNRAHNVVWNKPPRTEPERLRKEGRYGAMVDAWISLGRAVRRKGGKVRDKALVKTLDGFEI